MGKTAYKFQGIYYQLVILFIIFLSAFHHSLATLYQRWLRMDESQSHGLFVIAISFYLQYKRLRTLSPAQHKPSVLGIIFLSLSTLCWYVTTIVNIDILQQFLLVAIVFFIYWSTIGARSALAISPAIAYLIFAIPIWDYLSPSLVDIASYIVSSWIEVSQIPALIEGNSFFLPYGQIEIAGGCSGIRYLTIALVLAFYITLTTPLTTTRKIILILAAIGLGIFINWLRIFLIILVAYFSNMQSQIITDHEMLGWVLFIIVIFPLILMAKPNTPDTNIGDPSLDHEPTLDRPSPFWILLTVLAILIGPALVTIKPAIAAPNLKPIQWEKLNQAKITREKQGFMLTIDGTSTPNEAYLAATPDKQIGIDFIKNWQLSQSDNLIPYIYELFNSKIWSTKKEEQVTIKNNFNAHLTILEKKPYGQRTIVLHWFHIGQYATSNYKTAKLLQLPAMLQGQNLFMAIALSLNCNNQDCTEEQKALTELASGVIDISTESTGF